MRKIIFVFYLFYHISLFSWETAVENKIDFVKSFVEKITKEEQFSRNDEIHFFGDLGGIPGICLYYQLGLLDRENMLLKTELPISPIGILLQMKLKPVLQMQKPQIPLFFCNIEQLFVQRVAGLEKILSQTTYIMMIQMKRKDIMSIDNEISTCVFAVYEKEKTMRIDLMHSFFGGKRILSFLGFIPSDNFCDIIMPDNNLLELKKNLDIKDK